MVKKIIIPKIKIKPSSGDEAGTGSDTVSTPPPGISGGGSDESDAELRGRAKKGIAGSDDSGGADEGDYVKGSGYPLRGLNLPSEAEAKVMRDSVTKGIAGPDDSGGDYASASLMKLMKKAAIPIIVALVAACATLGFLYIQESNKLKDAQQALNTHIENNTSLQAEVNSLQGDILALEAEVKTLSESSDTATAAARK